MSSENRDIVFRCKYTTFAPASKKTTETIFFTRPKIFLSIMGRGDVKSKQGKRRRGSNGNSRPNLSKFRAKARAEAAAARAVTVAAA